MADIKQAAGWVQSAKIVQRRDEPGRHWKSNDNGWLVVRVVEMDTLWRKEPWHCDDLLADDWEIVESAEIGKPLEK